MKTLLSLFALIQFINLGNSQASSFVIDEKTFYAYEVDYLPCIKYFNKSVGAPTTIKNGLVSILEEVEGHSIELNTQSGTTMEMSGIFPSFLEDREWIYLEITDQSNISFVGYYDGVKEDKALSATLKRLLQKEIINPARRNGTAVTCGLMFLVE